MIRSSLGWAKEVSAFVSKAWYFNILPPPPRQPYRHWGWRTRGWHRDTTAQSPHYLRTRRRCHNLKRQGPTLGIRGQRMILIRSMSPLPYIAQPSQPPSSKRFGSAGADRGQRVGSQERAAVKLAAQMLNHASWGVRSQVVYDSILHNFKTDKPPTLRSSRSISSSEGSERSGWMIFPIDVGSQGSPPPTHESHQSCNDLHSCWSKYPGAPGQILSCPLSIRRAAVGEHLAMLREMEWKWWSADRLLIIPLFRIDPDLFRCSRNYRVSILFIRAKTNDENDTLNHTIVKRRLSLGSDLLSLIACRIAETEQKRG